MHIQKHTCSSCGYPAAKTRKCKFSTIAPASKKIQSSHRKSLSSATPTTTLNHRIKARINLPEKQDKTNTMLKQSNGARRPSAERPPDPAVCVLSRAFPDSSRTVSALVSPRVLVVSARLAPLSRRRLDRW